MQGIGTLYSYDYRTMASDMAAQRGFTTGALQDEFATGTAPALHSLAPKSQAIVQAKASPAAVGQLDGDKATVLVFLDQTVTSNLLKQPR